MTDTVTSFLYGLTCEGFCSEETGDVNENGYWYGRLEGPFTAENIKDWDDTDRELWEEMTKSERESLEECTGAIVMVDQQGFKYSEVYRRKETFDRGWSEIEKVVQRWYDDQEEEDDDSEDDNSGAVAESGESDRRPV